MCNVVESILCDVEYMEYLFEKLFSTAYYGITGINAVYVGLAIVIIIIVLAYITAFLMSVE